MIFVLGELEVIGITVFAAFIVAIAQYIFKEHLHKFGGNIKEVVGVFKNRWIIIGLIIYMIGLPIYLFALDNGQLSFVYPTFASSFVFILLISKYALKEKVGKIRVLGVMLVVLGIAVIAMTY